MIAHKIYDMFGRKEATLASEEKIAGSHIVFMNRKIDYKQNASARAYYYKFTTGNFVEIREMNLLE